MKSQRLIATYKQILLFLVLVGSKVQLFSQNAPAVPASRHYLRAPDTIPGTLPEMRDSIYWIGRMKQPDELVMGLPQILEMNNTFRQKMKSGERIDTALAKTISEKLESSPGLFSSMPDLYSKAPSEVADITKSMVDKEIKYLRKGEYGNILAIQYSRSELNELQTEMAYDKIGSEVKVQTGITTEDVTLRIIPLLRPEFVGLLDKNKTRWDVWNLDIIPIGSPVVVLHPSATGASLFVLSANGFGWVSSEKIALGDRQKINDFQSSKRFVVCTGDKVSFYSNANGKYASGSFRMGERLPLADNGVVLVPTRQLNGQLLVQKAWLRSNAEVHTGFLPYTRRNVLDVTFKLLDRIYDWTGAWFGRNHVTVLRDVFSCFGFDLPSSGELLSVYNSNTKRVYTNEGKEKQYSTILANEPFITFQITKSGHSQLYLGDYKGEPIVFDTHGYGYTDASGQDLEIRRACIGTVSLPNYFLKQDVSFVTLSSAKK